MPRVDASSSATARAQAQVRALSLPGLVAEFFALARASRAFRSALSVSVASARSNFGTCAASLLASDGPTVALLEVPVVVRLTGSAARESTAREGGGARTRRDGRRRRRSRAAASRRWRRDAVVVRTSPVRQLGDVPCICFVPCEGEGRFMRNGMHTPRSTFRTTPETASEPIRALSNVSGPSRLSRGSQRAKVGFAAAASTRIKV